jgi:hypothetical protein
MRARTEERHQSVIILAASPLAWAAHFTLCYVTASVWCAKQGSALVPLASVRTAIAVYTVIALAVIAFFGVSGYRAHRHGGEHAPHDDDTPEDRHRFIGFATVLLSGLSAMAVVYAALVAVFVESCQ